MLQNNFLPPIENDSFTLVLIRVCCRLVELDYRRNPELYKSYPPLRISGLAELYRCSSPFPHLYGTFIYISKAVAAGYKLREIPTRSPDVTWRAIHKRRVGRLRG